MSIAASSATRQRQADQFRANQEKFEPLDQPKLTDPETCAHRAVAGDQLFIRELNALVALRWTRGIAPNVKATQP